MSGWPQHPGAWRVAQACEEAAQRFERALHDLTEAVPAADYETRVKAATDLVKLAAEEMRQQYPEGEA